MATKPKPTEHERAAQAEADRQGSDSPPFLAVLDFEQEAVFFYPLTKEEAEADDLDTRESFEQKIHANTQWGIFSKLDDRRAPKPSGLFKSPTSQARFIELVKTFAAGRFEEGTHAARVTDSTDAEITAEHQRKVQDCEKRAASDWAEILKIIRKGAES